MGKTTEQNDRILECTNHKYMSISTVRSDLTTTYEEVCEICNKKRFRINTINKIGIKDE